MKEKTKISDVMQEKDETKRNEKYNQYVKDVTPTHNTWINLVNAFWVGGLICCLGQLLTDIFIHYCGMEPDLAASYNILILVYYKYINFIYF